MGAKKRLQSRLLTRIVPRVAVKREIYGGDEWIKSVAIFETEREAEGKTGLNKSNPVHLLQLCESWTRTFKLYHSFELNLSFSQQTYCSIVSTRNVNKVSSEEKGVFERIIPNSENNKI